VYDAVADLGTILGVWAHPDDEAYLSAGLMALARDNGQRVVVVTATLGELGTSDPETWAPHRLGPLRREEMAASMAVLGVHEHHWLGLPDGECAAVPLDAGARRIGAFLREVRPDTVVTFGPDGMTGHPDHRAVSAWTAAAWQAAGRQGRLLQATVTPEFHLEWGSLNDEIGMWMDDGPRPCTPRAALAVELDCAGELLERKLAALRAHDSQTAPLIAALGADTYRAWCAAEWFVDVADVVARAA
jgi:LmbE family N-acetylglucosaminyl deacetylase